MGQSNNFLFDLFFLFWIIFKVALADVGEAADGADILIFVVPHQFIKNLADTIKAKLKPSAVGLSLIKGFDKAEGGGIALISHIISKTLGVSITKSK